MKSVSRATLMTAAIWFILAGCNPPPGNETPTPRPTSTTAASPTATAQLTATPQATATPTAAPTSTAAPTATGTEVQQVALAVVAEGLTSPVGMAIPPDGSGRKFIIDQIGLVRVIDAGGNVLPDAFLDIRDRMVALNPDFDERGLLGLAFHPNYAQNGRFFIYYSAPKGPAAPADFNSELRLSEFLVSAAGANTADPASEQILLRLDDPQFNHNAGQLAFGPDDGYLYVSIGDGGAANDAGVGHNPTIGNGQDRSVLFGKLLRLDVSTPGSLAIPPDNPFVGVVGTRDEIWAYGLRNSWRFSFDTGGDRRLFLADVGQDLFEEINIVEKGGNYGWRIREAHVCFDPDNPDTPPASCATTGAGGEPLINPILYYPHTDPADGIAGLAAVGGFVYRGSQFPGLVGRYVFGDWSTDFSTPDGTLMAATEDSGGVWSLRELGVTVSRTGRIGSYILAFGQDADGELYVLTTQNAGPAGTTGRVRKLLPSP